MSLRSVLTAVSVVAVGFTTGALAGCQHEAGGATLAGLAGYSLHLVDDGDNAKLAYGQANSDNVGLMLECAKGSRRIEVSDVLRRGGEPAIRLASGETRSALRTEVQDFEGSKLLLARTGSNDPALQGFRKTGDLKVEAGGVNYGVSADPGERAAVDQFFTACNRV